MKALLDVVFLFCFFAAIWEWIVAFKIADEDERWIDAAMALVFTVAAIILGSFI